MKPKKKENQNVDVSFLLGREDKCSQEEIQGQRVEQGLKKRSSKDCPTWGSIHMQPSNPVTIADAKKCLLTGTRYGSLLRVSVRALLIQMRIVAANLWTEQGDPNEDVREQI